MYGLTTGGDLIARLVLADQWLQQHRDDPQWLLARGRMCLEQRLWGKAQSCPKAALSLVLLCQIAFQSDAESMAACIR